MDDKTTKAPDVVVSTHILDHILIRDKQTKEVLVNQRAGTNKGILVKHDKRYA